MIIDKTIFTHSAHAVSYDKFPAVTATTATGLQKSCGAIRASADSSARRKLLPHAISAMFSITVTAVEIVSAKIR